MNETLRFDNTDFIQNSEIYIYNRWGAEIYHSVNYKNDWDANGYPDGVYYYVLMVDGEEIKSSVTVAR